MITTAGGTTCYPHANKTHRSSQSARHGNTVQYPSRAGPLHVQHSSCKHTLPIDGGLGQFPHLIVPLASRKPTEHFPHSFHAPEAVISRRSTSPLTESLSLVVSSKFDFGLYFFNTTHGSVNAELACAAEPRYKRVTADSSMSILQLMRPSILPARMSMEGCQTRSQVALHSTGMQAC